MCCDRYYILLIFYLPKVSYPSLKKWVINKLKIKIHSIVIIKKYIAYVYLLKLIYFGMYALNNLSNPFFFTKFNDIILLLFCNYKYICINILITYYLYWKNLSVSNSTYDPKIFNN